MKKVVGLAAAGLLATTAANAGQITVANTDITLFGGVSAAYSAQDNDHLLRGAGFSKDAFSVNNVIVGLTKPAQDGGIGFTAAFGSWEAPTVVASSKVVNGNNTFSLDLVGHGKTTDFKPWLAFVSYKPVAGLTLDAGLLWTNFGERPVTILNPHITRGVLFTANPVAMAGARATYDAGIAKVYVGTGKVGAQLMSPLYDALGVTPKTYIEAGITGNLKQVGLPVDVGLHTYNEAGGRDIYALTVGGDLGIVSLGLEVDYFRPDKSLKAVQGNSDSAWGAALCANVKPMAGVQVPVRIEYADAKKSLLIPTIADISGGQKNSVWTFTVTPTYNPTKNTFIRAEVSYVNSDKKIFVNDKGNSKDSRTTGAVELGFLF
ncbi:outer membrane beta-barrel protein [Sulfurihydrogenibium subterraneum]|uniref:outer membrane beta-barrel protein n=1 Tax=Sulfurihydrogenibium subterraneum TaxID=171121 RepID=UPI000490BBA4|nr:outer membrane beta-barrel protein [Sulfurihydrogenibium subterraneum]